MNMHELAQRMRHELRADGGGSRVLLYGYNGAGKTRLSMAFKELGKDDDERDTLYFNAFTEDLFSWDNDLEEDADRRLMLNRGSRFFDGLEELEFDTRIRPLLGRYSGFDFRIDTEASCVRFSRTLEHGEGDAARRERLDNIKVSRGEESMFIWCFFLAVIELALDPDIETYKWVKYIYIDDPISSLDEHNAIAVAVHLAQMLKRAGDSMRTVISSHHTLFFNVLFNELGRPKAYFLIGDPDHDAYELREQRHDTPIFQHVELLKQLDHAVETNELYTYHFNMLRTVMECTACFHGLQHFGDCIVTGRDDTDERLHKRLLNLMSHGNYSLYEPREMLDENKEHFKKIMSGFKSRFRFNPALFERSAAEMGEK